MSNMTDNDPPYHIVNLRIRSHQGPFSSYFDAALARLIAQGGWRDGPIMNRREFGDYEGTGLGDTAVGWASSPRADTTAKLITLIRLAIDSVGTITDQGMTFDHIDPKLLD